LLKEIPPPVCNDSLISVSAASYKRAGLAGESIIAAFGTGLATTTEAAASLPLPITLAGTTVKLKDSAEKELLAPLFFVSPTQVNYLIPPGAAPGPATVTITSGRGGVATEQTQILTIAPGVFTANTDGRGAPAAVALRITADGSSLYEPVARYDPEQNRFVPLAIDLGSETDQVFLVLFATGLRGGDLPDVHATIGDAEAEVFYAGAHPDLAGVDQVNIHLPRRLAGRGEANVVLTIDDHRANPVTISVR
jgi:uncharacterized protein (TIGR03437 family)